MAELPVTEAAENLVKVMISLPIRAAHIILWVNCQPSERTIIREMQFINDFMGHGAQP
jgi:hypothetical protein